jgi:YVTN family beta-propeller protein
LTIEIVGNGFDPDPSKDKVTFATLTSSVNAFADSASLTHLTVKVPYGAVSGAIRVTSNGVLDDQDASNPTTYIFIGSFTDPCNTATGNIGVGSNPHGGAVDFNGANAYITNSGENTVSVITNLNTDDPVNKPPYLLTSIQVGTTPMNIDINTTGTRAYVTNFDSHTVSVIDLTDINGKKNQVIETIKVGIHPYGVVANGDKVYVANYGSDNITVINVDPASGGFDHAVANINTGTHNTDIDISPDGGILAVAGGNGLTLVKITKTALGFDYAVSNSNPGASTQDAKITKDGGTAIVTTTEGGIFFVDITPGDNYGAAYGNTNPGSKAGSGEITFDNLFYYVTNPDDNKVTVYRITYEGSGSGSGTISSSSRISLKEYATIPVGDSPEGIAMDPVNDKVVVVNSGSNNVTPVFICCPAVKTPSAYIKDLIFTVENMIYSGDIPKLRGYVLIFTLNSSLRNINAGRTKLAIVDLKAFIALVNTYIKNKQISTTNGNALVTAANAIIAKLQGTKSDITESYSTDVGQSNLPDLISESKIGAIYPNPFNESITIDYEIADMELNSGKVMIQIYDVTGRVVCNLVNKNMEPGRYSVTWNGRYENEGLVSKGIYYIRFAAGKTREVKRIMLVR